METENYQSFDNLLLDDLMDQGLVKLDVNIGVDPEQVAAFELEDCSKLVDQGASPSHQSDSGVSAMSSPAHSLLSEEEFSEDDPVESAQSIFPDLFDSDIVDYLRGDDSGSEEAKESSMMRKAEAVQIDFSSEDTENEEPVVIKPVVTRQQAKISDQTNNELRKSLQNVQPNVARELNNNKIENKVPAVKVIKVIKTPSASSKKEAEQQILEAIEDRNRKNAVQAKLNREKKKAYIKSLEDEINDLKCENDELREGQDRLKHANSALKDEVVYLKSVLANQSSLANLLKNIPNVKDVRLSSSFSQRKRSADLDHDYETPTKRLKGKAGVCLHVVNDNVSLEFCSKCSKMSQLSVSSDGED